MVASHLQVGAGRKNEVSQVRVWLEDSRIRLSKALMVCEVRVSSH